MEGVTDGFFQMCYAVAHEIWSKAESETGLYLGAISVMDKGHLINIPQFIYEFALDNYASGKQLLLSCTCQRNNVYVHTSSV